MTLLPEALERCRVPTVFSPTQLALAEHCLLRAVLGSSRDVPVLTSHPLAALGRVFHRVLELAVRGEIPRAGTPSEDAQRTLDRLIDEEEVRLATAWPHATPRLRELLAPLQWRQRRRAVLDLAEKYLAGSIPRAPLSHHGRPRDPKHLPPHTTWAEVQLDTPELRLRGRVDLIHRGSDDVTIRDLKTGRVVTREGEMLPHIERQMRLYGAMAHVVWPIARLSLIVDHGAEWTIEFGDEQEARLLAWLREVLGRLPADGVVETEALATPGRACDGCAHRHLCPAYRKAAPAFWIGETSTRMPLDTWGTVTGVERRADNLIDLSLRDTAHRPVRVFGLSEFRLIGVQPGDKVWLFGLNSRDKRGGIDCWRHPNNFFEAADDDRFARAWTLQTFAEK